MSTQTMTEVLVDHQRQNASSCLCGWAKLGHSHPEHQAEALAAAGYGIHAQQEVEWGTATKWGHRPSMSKENALDYIELCKACGDDVKLIKRRASIAPGPWEPGE